MSKCLVTRLQSVVNNDNLPIFGVSKVLYCNNYYTDRQLGYRLASHLVDCGKNSIADTLRFVGRTTDNHSYFEDVHSVQHTGEINEKWTTKFFNTSETENSFFDVYIYETSILAAIIPDLDSLIASDSLLALEPLQDNGKDGVFHTTTGSINTIGDKYPNLVAFAGTYLNSITGDIVTAFGKCKDIVSIDLAYTTPIKGSVEDLATALIANGRTDGYFEIYGNGVITAGGTAIVNNTAKFVSFSGGSYTISDTRPE